MASSTLTTRWKRSEGGGRQRRDYYQNNNRKEENKQHKERAVPRPPTLICCYVGSRHRDLELVAIESNPLAPPGSRLTISHITYVKEDTWRGGVGVAALGPDTAYVVGGNFYDIGDCHSKVNVCHNFRKDQLTGNYSCEVSDGPELNSPKPHPQVTTVNGKIYALAGGMERYLRDRKLKIKHPFEVLEPPPASDGGNYNNHKWKPLPPPPFKDLYSTSPSIFVQGHTVIGNCIYVTTLPHDVHCFDTESGRWITEEEGGRRSKDLKKCYWTGKTDFYKDSVFLSVLSYWPHGTKVFAYDLEYLKPILDQSEIRQCLRCEKEA